MYPVSIPLYPDCILHMYPDVVKGPGVDTYMRLRVQAELTDVGAAALVAALVAASGGSPPLRAVLAGTRTRKPATPLLDA